MRLHSKLTPLRRARSALALVAALSASAALADEQKRPADFASPAIDQETYAPGAVKAYTEQHQAWTMRCQEIARLHQRFCDLSSVAQGAGLSIALTVTTSDTGKPAGILRLPPGTLLRQTIAVSGKGEKTATRLRALRCEPTGCSTVWPLTPAQLASLQGGKGLTVDFSIIDPAFAGQTPAALEKSVTVTATISGQGFADAVKASQNPSPRQP